MLVRHCFRAVAALALVGCGAGAHRGPPPVTVGTLAGIIRTADTGAPVEDATIVLRRPGGELPVQEEDTDDTGAYLIPQLAPGTYLVKVYQGARSIGDERVAIVAGKVTGLDLAVAPGLEQTDATPIDGASATPLWRYRPIGADARAAAIEGTVSEVDDRTRLAGAVIAVVDRDGRLIANAVSDDDGRYRIDDVAPGAYAVSAYYTLLGRGQFEIRRTDVVLEAGEVVVVPLSIETDRF